MATSGEARGAERLLICRVGTKVCGLPLLRVIETMRPLPVEPLGQMPLFVNGLALIRGRATPVLDARTLLGSPSAAAPGRYVTLDLGPGRRRRRRSTPSRGGHAGRLAGASTQTERRDRQCARRARLRALVGAGAFTALARRGLGAARAASGGRVSAVLGTAELDLFQSAIVKRLGLRFDDNRLTFLAEVLTRRVDARRLSTGAYLAALMTELEASDELSALARELTVGETYFFRHADQFSALAEVAMPERLSARAASRSLRLLSAGCASGEEAYSLAILLRERGIEPGFDVAVQGVDLNPDSLAKAAHGLYSPWALRETPAEVKARWFVSEGRDFRLAQSLRDSVRFEQHNLILDAPSLLPAGVFDVIFCRNVLMYFTTEQAIGIVERLARTLAPGGFLFLGHAETLRGLSHAFHLRHTHNTFYYQRRDGAEPANADFEAPVDAGRQNSRPAPVRDNWVGPWLETVERSSARIRELSGEPTAVREPNIEATRASARDLSQPLELLRHERFADALEVMQQFSPAEKIDPAALLLRAAILTHQGELAEAEKCCLELLRFDDLNAGAHYLLALCCERRGHGPAAVEHDLTAVYLDAGFAMPHLHLGLMARRRRNADAARHELTQALSLLEREDASRLLLFGGGFSRAALLALCRSELTNLKGNT
jgi:chemotaxis protein methyltransferase CheR